MVSKISPISLIPCLLNLRSEYEHGSTQILNQTLLRNADSWKLFYIQTKETRLWSQTGLGTNLYHLGKLLDPLEFISVG